MESRKQFYDFNSLHNQNDYILFNAFMDQVDIVLLNEVGIVSADLVDIDFKNCFSQGYSAKVTAEMVLLESGFSLGN